MITTSLFCLEIVSYLVVYLLKPGVIIPDITSFTTKAVFVFVIAISVILFYLGNFFHYLIIKMVNDKIKVILLLLNNKDNTN